MGQIRVLDDHLANLIAAGEVIERPLNVVKECIENAIDAGADHIEVLLKDGGIEEIEIRDNGKGMDREDLSLAFERHATSKLTSQDDLFAIMTMGFRGEALASIASVANVEMVSNNGQECNRILIEYGKKQETEPASAPLGTKITIKNLFSHTPARFKYLKRPAYEFSLIADCVNKLALAYPGIRFVLKHNGKISFQSRGNGKLEEIFYQLYGKEVAKTAFPFEGASDDYHIKGLAAHPGFSRANSFAIYLSVNSRIIRSNLLVKSILRAYEEYMPDGRFPIVCLQIEVDPQLIDVNVSPNKWQIRFSKERQLFSLIENTLKARFHAEYMAPEIIVKDDQRLEPYETEKKEVTSAEVENVSIQDKKPVKFFTERPSQIENTDGGDLSTLVKQDSRAASVMGAFSDQIDKEESSFFQNKAERIINSNAFTAREKSSFMEDQKNCSESFPDILKDESLCTEIPHLLQKEGQFSVGGEQTAVTDNSETKVVAKQEVIVLDEKGNSFLDHLKIIGQFKESYILCESEEGLVIIDQHAAQERFHFEQLVDSLDTSWKYVQPLMVPILIHVNPALIDQVDKINDLTKQYGIVFKVFGNQLMVTQEPLWLRSMNKQEVLEDLLSIFSQEQVVDVMKLRRHVIATMACHQSIRFNRGLSLEEMKQVVEDLKACRQPFHCPHGRPTLITLKEKQLIKEFNR